MPQFIKMGIGGTGYLGKQSSHARSVRRYKARRKILPGFPITTPFNSINEVREYLSGDTMICLLCGKNFKSVGHHIKIHDITIDEYKERYNIPWTYALICEEFKESHSKMLKKRIAEGTFEPLIRTPEELAVTKKRKCKFKSEVAIQNLGDHTKPIHPLTKAPDGQLETFTAKRERLTTKQGTPEFKEKMVNRPQCQPDAVRARGFHKLWVGKKQSAEHKAKRFAKR